MNIQPAPRPTFSSINASHQAYIPPPPGKTIDLTKEDDDDDCFDPESAISAEGSHFASPDPFSYVDPTQANENIKNLLEGAFDDEDDKSRTRLRKRAKMAMEEGRQKEAESLADKLASLKLEEERKAAAGSSAVEAEEEEEEEDGTVEGLAVKLLPHQVEGVAWMIDKEVGQRKRNGVLPNGGILADDMGLGKTVQSVALMLTNPRPAIDAKPEHPKQKMPGKEVGKGTLVVAPLALIKQWEDEIKTKVAKKYALRVLIHHGSSRTKSSAELKKYDVVITTYQTLTSEHAGSNMAVEGGIRIGCMGVHWYRVILDEAHSIKNRNAKSTQACYALNSWYRWCLTGTPMQNNLDELQSLIKFLRIKPYCELQRWKEGITQPMKNGRGGLAMKRLQVFLRAFMKRRTKDILKKEGALNFNDKSKEGSEQDSKNEGMKIVKREIITMECDFDKDEKEFYVRLQNRADRQLQAMMKDGKGNDYIGALVLLLRLRQACDHFHLVGQDLSNDKDAMTIGSQAKETQRTGNDAMDDLTAMMSGVSMESKTCSICQAQLSVKETHKDSARCDDCTSDLTFMTKSKSNKLNRSQIRRRRRKAHQLPEDSDEDDEEGEGEWVADGPERHIDLGKAGGTDDEDAEGGGESLDSIDSNRSEDEDSNESDSPPRARLRRGGAKSESENEDESNFSGSDSVSNGDILTNDCAIGTHDSIRKPVNHPSTKIRQLLRILHEETPTYKTIVFSQFTSMLDLIEPHLNRAGMTYVRYDGSMRNDAREAALQSLRTDPRTRVLLCSLKCGSLGLNLTAASRVVIVEPFWNPFVEEQAIDRVHRLNQTVDVKVFRLTIRDSVEERILALQERKRELAAAAIEGAGNKVGKLTMQDIMTLFKHDGGGIGAHEQEDREMWAKFGADAKLLDGPNGGFSGAKDVGGVTSSRAAGTMKPGRARYQEHNVFGRRW